MTAVRHAQAEHGVTKAGGRTPHPPAETATCTARTPETDGFYRDIDRLFRASLGSLTFGISPISLVQAWQDWVLHLAISPGKQREIQVKLFEKAARLQHLLACCALEGGKAAPCISPLPQDRRFRHPSWQAFPFNTVYQSFLLTQQWWHNATTGVPGVTRKHERLVEFYSRQLLDMLSPSNVPFLNPEVIEATRREGGANLVRGAHNLADDLARLVNDGQAPVSRPGYPRTAPSR